MDSVMFFNLKMDFLNSLKFSIKNYDQKLWKFWLYYFFMKNKKLKKNQIGEIEDYLDIVSIPREDLQFLDDDILTFFIGYTILTKFNYNKPYQNKLIEIKKELEKFWNNKTNLYFENKKITLLILLFDKENAHKQDIIKLFKETNDCALLLIIFMIFKEENNESEIKKMYLSFLNKAKKKYYSIPDSEKIYVAWVLWKYRKLGGYDIKKIREIVSSYILMLDWAIEEVKDENLNFRTPIYYDLLLDFEKNTRIAIEEIPIAYRILGGFSGIIIITLTVYCYYVLFNVYLQYGLIVGNILNIIATIFSVLFVTIGIFLIWEICKNRVYTDEEIKHKLKNWLIDKYLKIFIVGSVILGIIATIIMNNISNLIKI